ncbi:MAG: GntR family transcriptional regulator [Rhodobacteraceae bacterium]|nr:GntR family transcriptional regulator [Paracoccaceae bacterium]
MARTDVRFRRAYNRLIELCGALAPGGSLPSENALAAEFGVSRTVVRAGLKRLVKVGILSWDGREKTVLRCPEERDRLALDGSASGDDMEELEARFLDWVLRFDVPAGTPLNVAQLSRDFGVAPHRLQEFLSSFTPFGLVERRPHGGWTLLGFTRDFAVELSEFRSVLELNAVRHVVSAPVDHSIWRQLGQIRGEHLALKEQIDAKFHDFSKLDERFHTALNSVVRNRFVAEFQKVISLIFHYHYMWDKTDERRRNAAAIEEHLALIDALEKRDEAAAEEAARCHLRTSMTTLLSSLRDHQLG